jgi:N utilization substance protein B
MISEVMDIDKRSFKMKRRQAREFALQALFQMDMSDITPHEALAHIVDEKEIDPYLDELVTGTHENITEIDTAIKENLEKWSLDRLAKVDRNILRIAVYELLFVDDVPASVAINEALEVAKLFGDEKSSKFINGVLSNIKPNEK